MSDLANDVFIENLFDRLEALEPVVSMPQYEEMQKDLLGLIVRLELEEAHQAVIKWEQDYSGPLSDIMTQDRQEVYSDVF